jgi:glycosyltransferase involved in cell wall biosynthesis
MKPKLLCILHNSPPVHGAAKVGDFIFSSEKLKEVFECRFITIKSSDTIGDIGKISLKKFYLVAELYFKVLWALLTFQPQKIYFTASIRGVAFYRDLLVSTLWKFYKLFKSVEVYYHYHTMGIDEFVSISKCNLKLTRFFIKDVNLLLLSPLLEKDTLKVKSYKKIHFLPNGVEDPMVKENFEMYMAEKYSKIGTIEVLYLAHMMKEKGYLEVLELAKNTKGQNICYHFAGNWKDVESKSEFFEFIKEYRLEEIVIYHGFVSGNQKIDLFKKAHVFLYPTKFEAFGIAIIEALSFGVPVIATDEGSIPYILDKESGIVLHDINKLSESLEQAKQNLLNKGVAMHCRQRYLDNFSIGQFENNLVNTLKG